MLSMHSTAFFISMEMVSPWAVLSGDPEMYKSCFAVVRGVCSMRQNRPSCLAKDEEIFTICIPGVAWTISRGVIACNVYRNMVRLVHL